MYKIIIETYNNKLLHKITKNNPLFSNNLLETKKKNKFVSLIRSPHANKNSQEQFETVLFRVFLTPLEKPKAKLLFNFLFLYQPDLVTTIETRKPVRFVSFF